MSTCPCDIVPADMKNSSYFILLIARFRHIRYSSHQISDNVLNNVNRYRRDVSQMQTRKKSKNILIHESDASLGRNCTNIPPTDSSEVQVKELADPAVA